MHLRKASGQRQIRLRPPIKTGRLALTAVRVWHIDSPFGVSEAREVKEECDGGDHQKECDRIERPGRPLLGARHAELGVGPANGARSASVQPPDVGDGQGSPGPCSEDGNPLVQRTPKQDGGERSSGHDEHDADGEQGDDAEGAKGSGAGPTHEEGEEPDRTRRRRPFSHGADDSQQLAGWDSFEAADQVRWLNW
jgi:hypothetical protein